MMRSQALEEDGKLGGEEKDKKKVGYTKRNVSEVRYCKNMEN